MMDHKIRFKGVIWKIIPKFSCLPLLILSTLRSEILFRADIIIQVTDSLKVAILIYIKYLVYNVKRLN